MSQGSALKFVVDIQNQEAINKLTKDIEVQENSIKKLNAAFQKGAISEFEFGARAIPLGENIRVATAELQKLQTASAMTGRGLMQLGYAVDDIQYGFSAIVNNIPQIAMGFGAGAGLAGGIAIASVAISQLIKHWGELSDIAQSAWSGGSLDQLSKIREEAEKATEAFKKLSEEHTKQQQEGDKFRHEGIVEGGVGKILQGLAFGVRSEPGMRSDQDTAKEIMTRGLMLNAAPEDKAAFERQVQERHDKIDRETAAKMLVAIEKGDKIAMATARRWVRAAPGAFPKDFVKKLDPEGAADEANRLANLDADTKGNKNIREAEKAAEAEKLRMNKELTAEGARLETQGKREQLEQEKRDIQERIKRGEHVLTPQGKKELQDQMLGGRAPEASKIMSMKAFADNMLTSGMNSVPQKQLDTLKDMHTELKSIDKKIGALGLQ